MRIIAPPAICARRFCSRNNRFLPLRVFTNPNRSLFSRSTAIFATEFLSPKSIPTKIVLRIGSVSFQSLILITQNQSRDWPLFLYIVNSSDEEGIFAVVGIPLFESEAHNKYMSAKRNSQAPRTKAPKQPRPQPAPVSKKAGEQKGNL